MMTRRFYKKNDQSCFVASSLAALLIFAGVLLFPGALLSRNIPQKSSGYVTDQSGILSTDQKRKAESILQGLFASTGAQVFVLISDTTGDLAVEEYTLAVAESWKPGSEQKDDGLLFAVFLEDRTARMEVGYGLEGIIPDIVAKQILSDTMIPYFKEGKYGEGILAALKELDEKIRAGESPRETDLIAWEPEQKAQEEESCCSLWVLIGLPFLFAAIFSFFTFPFESPEVVRFDPDLVFRTNYKKLFQKAGEYGIAALVFGGVLWVGMWIVVLFLLVLITNPPSVDSMSPFYFDLSFLLPSVGILLTGVPFAFYIKRLEKEKEVKKIEDLLESNQRWDRLLESYDNGSVEQTRLRLESMLPSLKSRFTGRGRVESFRKFLQRTLDRPSDYFSYKPEYLETEMKKNLSTQVLDHYKSKYDPEHVEQVFANFRQEWEQISSSASEQGRKATGLLDRIQQLRRNPAGFLDLPLTFTVPRIRAFLENDSLWRKWGKRFDLDKTSLLKQKVKNALGKIQEMNDSPEKRTYANDVYRKKVERILKNPGAYLKKEKKRKSAVRSSRSSYSSSSSYSFSNNSYSSGSSYSGSSYVSGGGGSFGGGGASSSW